MDEPIRLAYGWPDGLMLDVIEERHVESADPSGSRTYRSRNRYRLVRDGVVIRVKNHHREVLEHTPSAPGTFDHQRILRFVEECGPDFVVDAEAQAIAVLPEAVAAVRRAVTPPAGAPAGIVGLIERFSNERALLVMAQNLWNPMVGSYAGLELPRTRPYRIVAEIGVPALGGFPIQHFVDTLVDAVGPDGHVRIRCDVVPDPEELARMTESIAAPGLGGVRVRSVESLTRMVLDTHADSLVPARVEVVRDSWAEAVAPGTTEVRRGGQRDHRTWTFTASLPLDD